MFDNQIKTCQEIFRTELEVLSPKFVIMFIGNYGKREMLSYINGGVMPQETEIVGWSSYKAMVYKIGEILFICSEHPMRKEETAHINCIRNLIQKYK